MSCGAGAGAGTGAGANGGAEPPVTTLAQHQQITRCTDKLVRRHQKTVKCLTAICVLRFCVTILYLHLHSHCSTTTAQSLIDYYPLNFSLTICNYSRQTNLQNIVTKKQNGSEFQPIAFDQRFTVMHASRLLRT